MTKKQDEQVTSPAPMAVRRENQNSIGPINGGDVDLQVRTAKAFPRDIVQFKSKALEMVSLDKETAESCSYAFKRGGKIIEGPSARLAEIIASSWGNLRVAAKTTGADNGFIYAESVCWDLESNVAVSFETRRKITDKEGKRYSEDMIGVTGNAATSIAFRNSVFRVVPRAYINEIWQASQKVAAGGLTLAQRLAEMLSWFEGQGVTEQQIIDLLNVPAVGVISKEQLAMLRGFAQSIRDGISSISEIFNGGCDHQDNADVPEDENTSSAEVPPSQEAEEEQDEPLPEEKTPAEKPIDIPAAKAEAINQILTRIGELTGNRDDAPARAQQLKLLNETFGAVELKKIELLPLPILQAGLRTLKDKPLPSGQSNLPI